MNKCYLGASDPYLKAATASVKWQQEWKHELLTIGLKQVAAAQVEWCAGAGSEGEREPERK